MWSSPVLEESSCSLPCLLGSTHWSAVMPHTPTHCHTSSLPPSLDPPLLLSHPPSIPLPQSLPSLSTQVPYYRHEQIVFEVQPPEVTITVTNNSLTVEVSELETFRLCRCVQMSVYLFMYMYMYMNALHVHVCSLPFLCVSLCSLHLRSKDSPCRGRFYSPKRYLQAA